MTVFDVNSAYVDRYYLWTSITRATYLNNVTIFKHPEYVVSASERSKIKQYFKLKVDGYKQQDRIVGRCFEANDFITAEWISDEYEKLESQCCSSCRIPYETIAQNGKVCSNMTVDRIDSTLAHTKNNCRLLCAQCNATKGNKY